MSHLRFAFIRLWLLAGLCLGLATPAAAGSPEAAWLDGPCADEIEALCPRGDGDRRAVSECLRERREELSAECRERMSEAREHARTRFRGLRAACGEDVASHCPDVSFGRGRLARCLEDHADVISNECYAALGELRVQREGRD